MGRLDCEMVLITGGVHGRVAAGAASFAARGAAVYIPDVLEGVMTA